jgi:hypothetical protein
MLEEERADYELPVHRDSVHGGGIIACGGILPGGERQEPTPKLNGLPLSNRNTASFIF